MKSMHFFSIYVILPADLDPRVYSVSDRNEYRSREILLLGNKAWPILRADNLTAICESIF
jgi:hypothetical protein